MRQLHLIHSLRPEVGGPSEVIRQLAPPMKRMGHELDVISLDEPSLVSLEVKGAQVRCFPGWPRQYGYSRALPAWMDKHTADYDAIIVHGLWQFIGLATHRAAVMAGVPYYVFPHGMLAPWFKHRYPLKHLKKALYWKAVEGAVLRDAKAVLFTSVEEREQAHGTFSPYHCREQIAPIGTTGPTEDPSVCREAFLKQFPALRGRRLILFLGRLHEKKGCDLLIRAFGGLVRSVGDRMNDCDLVFAGLPSSEAYGRMLKAMATEYCPENRVHWLGMVRDTVKWGAYFSSDVFVLCSHQENFGVAVAESLACGLPVLISKEVNIWREIESDDAGFCDGDSARGCHELLRRWLELPEGGKAQMRAAAKRCFEQRYEAGRAARLLVEALHANDAPMT